MSVYLTVRKLYCGKTAEWIWVPFGVLSTVGRGIDVLDGGGYRQRGRGSFGGEFWVSRCNQWGLCCIVVRQRRTLPKLLWENLLVIWKCQVSIYTRCSKSMHFDQSVWDGSTVTVCKHAP